jgi:hypothetical protein
VRCGLPCETFLFQNVVVLEKGGLLIPQAVDLVVSGKWLCCTRWYLLGRWRLLGAIAEANRGRGGLEETVVEDAACLSDGKAEPEVVRRGRAPGP